MKKAIKIIIVFFIVSFIISIVATVYLFKNGEEIIGGVSGEVSKLNEEASHLAEKVTGLTTEKQPEKTTQEKTKAEESEETTEKETEAITSAAEEKSNEKGNNDIEILNSYVGKPLEELIAKVGELGYKATYLAEGEDFTGFIEDMADLYLTGELEIDTVQKTVSVTLVSKSKLEWANKKELLKEKLDPYYAWKAVEEYGIEQYYDFELHYISGKIAEELEDENTWSLKATCTIFGTEQICEAKVTGTTDNPEVVYFDFYS